ncbi:MAG: D-alanyl-D-alanine carboxypeptidase family protein, partial [Anaerotignaceae bacterium]
MKNIFKPIVLLITFTLFLSTVAFAAPSVTVNTSSAILIEKNSGTVLFEKNADKKMYPASMTKILTALILLDYFEPSDVIVVGAEVNEVSLDSSKAGHRRGESISVENLIRGLIIPSGNDTSEVVACAVAKKALNDEKLSFNECNLEFAKLMNKKAVEIGCVNTNFVNPHGYHDDNHYTTARDLAKISQVALDNSLIKEIFGERRYSGNSVGDLDKTGLTTYEYNWVSHNLLITAGEYAYPYATGMKTGFTNEAGHCVAASAEKDGVELIAIIFDSEDPNRWLDAATLFDYGFDNFSYNSFAKSGDTVGELELHNHKAAGGDFLEVVVKEDIGLYLDNEVAKNLETEIVVDNPQYMYESKEDSSIKVNAPVAKDDELGTIVYKYNDEVLAQTKVYAGRDVEKASFFERVVSSVKEFFQGLFTVKGLTTA